MSDATPEHEREARRQQRDFDRIQNAATGAVFYMGAAAEGVMSLYVAIAAAIGFAARDRSIVMGFIASDPPDFNYRVETRMRRGTNISFSRFVDDPAAKDADAVLQPLTLGSAALRAMLRASERALGARLEGAERFAEQRHTEALRFGLRAADENRRYAAGVPALASAFAETDSLARRSDLPVRMFTPPETVVPRRALSAEALSLLYAAGVPASFLEMNLPLDGSSSSFDSLAVDLRLSSRNARRYSNYLERSIVPELGA